jgi:acyl-coenzyme A thioesterase PaaI-like protein
MDGFELEASEVRAHFDPRAGYRGLVGTLHGGISAAAVDEIMVWAGILVEGVVSVTATMELRYRKPLGVEERIKAGARVTERRGRRLTLAGWLEVDGELAVEGSGLYIVTEQVSDIL